MAKRRKNGAGSLRQRPDGRWEGRYYIGTNLSGFPKCKSVYGATKAECEEKLDKLVGTLGAIKLGRIKPDTPFGQWLSFWYDVYCRPNLKESTQVNYEATIRNHILPNIAEIPLNALTTLDLQMFYNHMKTHGRLRYVEKLGSGLSNSAVRHCHLICHSALERARIEGLIRSNPSNGCKLPPKRSREMQILSKNELRRFLYQAKEDGYFEFFLLALATGMRRGEISALQWEDLNTRTGELTICRQVNRLNNRLSISETKTKSSARTVVLPLVVVRVLEAYREKTDSRWMFPSPVIDDAPHDPTAWRRVLSRILERTDCKHVRFHDLRHTFATAALEYGMDVKTLSTVIGHTTSATTLDVYAHITNDMLNQAALIIERGIAKNDVEEEEEEAEEEEAFEFVPYQPKIRKPGTGCVYQINDHLFEGKYSPVWVDGKRRSFNVYGHTQEECETLLAMMIEEKKAERDRLRQESKERGKPRS